MGRKRLPGCLLICKSLLVFCLLLLQLDAALGENENINDAVKNDDDSNVNSDSNLNAKAHPELAINDKDPGVAPIPIEDKNENPDAAPKVTMTKQEMIVAAAQRAQEDASTKKEDLTVEDHYRFDYDNFDPEAGYNPENYYVGEREDYEDEDLESGFHMDDFTPDHVLSFPVESGREECFFSDVETVPLKLRGAYFVSGGGALDINMKVAIVRVANANANNNVEQVLKQYAGKSENVFSLSATEKGQYSFCFNNPSSRYGEKTVTFALNVGKRQIHKEHAKGEHMVRLANTLHESRRTLHELEGEAHFLQERTRRHMLIQDSTEWRVAWYTVFESLFMFAITIGQVAYVQRLINQRAWV